MSRHYEELSGASGRARSYRPARLNAQQHFSGHAPQLHFDDQSYALSDLSTVGFGASTAGEVDDIPGDEPVRRGVLRLTQRGREIFAAPARRARLDIGKGRHFAGFALESGVVDLAHLRRANAAALAAGQDARSELAIPPDYKALTADALEFVGAYLSRIDRYAGLAETEMPWHERRAVASELAAECAPAWRALLMQGNALSRPLHDDKPLRAALKTYTENTLTRTLCGGESWRRSYLKPQGYPGDFRIMNFMYDATPKGDGIASMFLHMTGVIAGQPIVSRMRRLAELIVARAAEIGSARPVQITSVGAGPARELERVAELSPPGVDWRVTLVDQEAEALEYAIANVRRRRLGLSLTPLNVSFKDMLVPSSLTEHFTGQDVIYSSGLVDYLSPMASQRFVRRMYEFLAPGGAVIIGNVNDIATGTLWPMEYVLDWTLYFRSEAEMAAMAAGFDPAQVSIVADEMNAIHFLVVRKPA